MSLNNFLSGFSRTFSQKSYILTGDNSTGFDIQNFNAVVHMIQNHVGPRDTLRVVVDERHQATFEATLQEVLNEYQGRFGLKPDVQIVPHKARDSDDLTEKTTQLRNQYPDAAILPFKELPAFVRDLPQSTYSLTTSGKPPVLLNGYVRVPKKDIRPYEEQLGSLQESNALTLIPVTVMGQKHESDRGKTLTERQEEGKKQTLPLNIAAKAIEEANQLLKEKGIRLVPILCQYGNRTQLEATKNEINKTLEEYSQIIELINPKNDQPVDWGGDFYPQFCVLQAMLDRDGIVLSNASTLPHQALALGVQDNPVIIVGKNPADSGLQPDSTYWSEDLPTALGDSYNYRERPPVSMDPGLTAEDFTEEQTICWSDFTKDLAKTLVEAVNAHQGRQALSALTTQNTH